MSDWRRSARICRSAAAAVALACVCCCLAACGTVPAEAEEVIEGYTEKTVLYYSNPSGGIESEIQDLRAEGNGVRCAVTDRTAAETSCYRLSGGEVTSIGSVSWMSVRIGTWYNSEDPLIQPESREAACGESDRGLVLLPEGGFAAVGMNDGRMTLTVYGTDATVTEGISGYGLPVYEDRFAIGEEGEDALSRYELFPADGHTVVMIPSLQEETDDHGAVFIDLRTGTVSALPVEADRIRNGFLQEGLLYCCDGGELKAVDIRTGEDSASFEPYRLAEEETEIRIIGKNGENLFWTNGEEIRVFSEAERKSRRIVIGASGYSAEEGWTVRRACADSNGDLYLQYEREFGGAKETALVCWSEKHAEGLRLGTLGVAATVSENMVLDGKGIRLTEIISERFQPEELWDERHAYLTDWYQQHLHADFDDPVIRPDCGIEGCDHQSPSCEAWTLRSSGTSFGIALGGRELTVTAVGSGMEPDPDADPRLPDGIGLLIRSEGAADGEGGFSTAIPDVIIPAEKKLYFDGRYLLLPLQGYDAAWAALYVLDTETGTIVREIRTPSTAGSVLITDEGQILIADYGNQTGMLIDPGTWQAGYATGILYEADRYGYRYDGSAYTAVPLFDLDSLSALPNPYGMDHSQVFLISGRKGLVRYTGGNRDETAIADLDTGEILSGTVPMKNEWGEDIPIIRMATEEYYVFRRGIVWNERSFPAPPDYFDGILNGTYRYAYAFIQKDAFWNGSMDYTEFEMP